jgi:formate/nitrite transporter FocA (FNT family)
MSETNQPTDESPHGDPENAGESPHLDTSEKDQAAQHSAPRALVLHEIIRLEGEQDLQRTAGALAFSGLAGGLSMGFSFLTQALMQAGLPDAIWRHEIASLGYSIGFIIVVLGRQQLFTESTLTAILPVMTRRDAKTVLLAARFWIIVLAANLAGTWIFAAMLTIKGVFTPDVNQALADIARQSIASDFLTTFVKAMFAGWLIALMVWILPSARSAKLLTILIITYVVSLAHLSHIVAGSSEAAYDVYSGAASFGDYVTGFLLPTLCGNIIGGVALVSLLNHGAIAPEISERQAMKMEVE